jgi:hypothetical protein
MKNIFTLTLNITSWLLRNNDITTAVGITTQQGIAIQNYFLGVGCQ